MKKKKKTKSKKKRETKTKPKPQFPHPYGDPVGTRDDPQAVYDPRCYGE